MAGNKPASSSDVPKHRACDECRSRKLACSKEADGCSRCRREGIACYYSPQKPMGRPRKRRAADDAHEEEAPTSSSRRRNPSTYMRRSDSACSSAPSTGPEMHSFQLNSAPAPSSFGDHNFGFLDQHMSSPDMAFLDLLPAYYQDGGGGVPPQVVSSPQLGCTAQSFSGALPMAHDDSTGAFGDMIPFLDPVFASGNHGDNYDAYGTTPALSAGSHTPYNSEPSYSPPPTTHGVSPRYPVIAEEYTATATAAAAASTTTIESLRPIPTVTCPCLSSLYMSLESLANLPRDISAALRVTRHASKIAHSVVRCKSCSSGMLDLSRPPPMQCFQNMMLLATLVPSACNAYTAIVEMIDHECHLAMRQSRRIYFSAREIGGAWDHQAFGRGGGSPPAAVQEFDNSELEPHDWRRLMLAIIRLDVYGNKESRRPSRLVVGSAASAAPTMGLSDVIAALDERNNKRHEMLDSAIASGFEPTHARHFMMTPRSCRPEDRNCVRVLEVARLALNNLVIA